MERGKTLLGTRMIPDVVPGFSPVPPKPPAPPQARTGPGDVRWQGNALKHCLCMSERIVNELYLY